MADNHHSRVVDNGIGILEAVGPLRMLFRNTPSRALKEVDLSGFSSLRVHHFTDILESIDAKSLFKNVYKLNVQNCVLELKDLEWLSRLMPQVWFIVVSAEHIILPEKMDDSGMGDKETNQLTEMLERCDGNSSAVIQTLSSLPSRNSKCRLQIISQLTRLFSKLELIQLE